MAASQGNQMVVTFHRPGVREKIFFLASGVIMSVPLTLFVELYAGDYLSSVLPVFLADLFSIAIFAPLIEEFAKAYPLFYRHGETEKGIFTLGFLVGLGFGISEFFVYVVGQGVPIYIRFPGIFFHAASTSITAYGIAVKQPLKFYLVAVVLHFSTNFSALLEPVWFAGGTAAILITYIICWRLYRKTSERMVE